MDGLMENHIKMDDLGVSPFSETPIFLLWTANHLVTGSVYNTTWMGIPFDALQ